MIRYGIKTARQQDSYVLLFRIRYASSKDIVEKNQDEECEEKKPCPLVVILQCQHEKGGGDKAFSLASHIMPWFIRIRV